MPSYPLTNIVAYSSIPDPLPLYSRRDPETASIRSSAPSYTSEAPTYHTAIQEERHESSPSVTRGLQPPTYVPGFRRSTTLNAGDLSIYNFNQWSSARNGPQARHYHNVANRRATLAGTEEEARLNALTKKMAVSPLGGIIESPLSSVRTEENHQGYTPISPQEDPALVGAEAAAAAKERRLLMEKCNHEREALHQESKSWDFMLSQMADRHERQRSWDNFRVSLGRSQIIRSRIDNLGRRRLR